MKLGNPDGTVAGCFFVNKLTDYPAGKVLRRKKKRAHAPDL
jgi:hypothetical protein